MIIEKNIDKIKKYIIENTDFVEDDRRVVEDSKKIKYDKNIVLDINSIMSYKDLSNNYRYRFLIEYDLRDGEKGFSALVIMKNPSKADKKVSDATINIVLQVMSNINYSKVYIMNLMPEYASDPNNLHIKNFRKDMLEINDKLISLIVNKVSDIYVAWGSNNSNKDINKFFELRIKLVKNELKKAINEERVYYNRINKDGEPNHPGRGGWNKNMNKDDFEKYKLIQF